jgi:hypothetical protein
MSENTRYSEGFSRGKWLLIAVFLVMAAMCGVSYITLNAVQKRVAQINTESSNFAKTSIAEVAADWDIDKFMNYADPSFKEKSRRTELEAIFTKCKETLGPLKSLGELKRQGLPRPMVDKDQKPMGSSLDYMIPASFEKGNGSLKVKIRYFENKFYLLDIGLDSDKFKPAP